MPVTDLSLEHALQPNFVLEEELGRGGMATVYRARDVRHERPVALKILHAELAATLGPERFLREIRVTARLQHPHILPVFDSGDAGGRLWYAMPYVAGNSLRDRLRRETQLPVEDALRISRQVADALAHAHQQGIIHRDIKPENILLDGDRALVADFGIARAVDAAGSERLTETGMALGTPAYMSPEQAAAGPVDARSDIYALGCVLYEMLAGEPPFTGPTPQAIIAKRFGQPAPPLRTVRETVPDWLDRAIGTALARVPADRFGGAAEFGAALAGAELKAPAASPPSHRRRAVLIGLGTAALLLIAFTLLSRKAARPASLDPALVAVLPFRVSGAQSELGWLREGMIDLLALRLTSETGLRTTEPRAVLSAVQRLSSKGAGEISPERSLDVARGLGAGRVIDGAVVGTPARLTLQASLMAASGNHAGARASVEGPVDSLPALVDRLAAQLLGLQAGGETYRLRYLASSSLPAVRAFLDGRAAFRRGRREEAAQRFEEATRLDSTFALAALERIHAGFGDEDEGRAWRLVRAGRDRLSPSDRVLLDVWGEQWSTAPEMFKLWEAAVSAYPGRAELWYGLGDSYYHWGMLAGMKDPLKRADEAFHRGWVIDSSSATDSIHPEGTPIFAEWLIHMVESAQIAGDTAEVRRLASLGLAANSTTDQAWYLRWHLAVAAGDSARRAFLAMNLPCGLFGLIAPFMTWTGLPGEDGQRIWDKDRNCPGTDPDFARVVDRWHALNRGRPREGLRTIDPASGPVDLGLRHRIGDALYWEGDTSAAAWAARRLQGVVAAPSTPKTREDRYRNLCILGQWDLAQGRTDHTDEVIQALRSAGDQTTLGGRRNILCSSMLAAFRAVRLRAPDAASAVERFDSIARTFIFQIYDTVGDELAGTNLVAARLWEERNDLPRALAAVRRRAGGYLLAPLYLSTFFREEGRLAALTGDTSGAIRAYQAYLALRSHPAPETKAEVERVRGEVQRLLGDRPKL